MLKRATLQDVADAAGVSYATADRVVNARGGVASKSRVRVEEAIKRLNYVRDERAANLARGREYCFRALIPDGPNAFFASLRMAIAVQQTRLLTDRVDVETLGFHPFDMSDLVAKLATIDPDEVDGIAVVASREPAVTEALKALKARGVAIVTIVADAQEEVRDAYVGLDNLRAGQLAARLIAFAHRGGGGRILSIAGTRNAPDHIARLQGFDPAVVTRTPDVELLPTQFGSDDPREVEQLVADALRSGSPITGLYNAGAGNEGLVRALEAHDGPRPAIVLHELGPATRAAMQDDWIDVVIDQKPQEEVRLALRYLRLLADRKSVDHAPLAPAIYMQDNLPDDPNREG